MAAQNAAGSGSTSACLTSAMEGYGAATYGDAIADVYDQWYSTRLDPTAAVDLLAELAGSGAVLELLSERVAQLNREKEALLQAVSADQRTGLANAAAFDADHAQLHARFERSSEPYSVVLVDVDHFHEFNHRYRYHYLAGNRALRQLADTLAATVRKGDRVYRWGGEEFAPLLPSTRVDSAVLVAERIRCEVQGMAIEHCGNPSGVVTVTVGVVEAGQGESADGVFESVSALLVEGKDAGRNRVVHRPAGG